MIVPSFYPIVGGAEQQAQRQSCELSKAGWTVTVLTRRHSTLYPEQLLPDEVIDGVPVKRVACQGGRKLAALAFVLRGLFFLITQGRHQIYHAHDVGGAGWLSVMGRYFLDGRAILKLRSGQYYYERSYRSPLARWQFKTLLCLADGLLVVNQEMIDYLTQLGIARERIRYLPNAVDTTWFCPATQQEKSRLRHALGLPETAQIVLYVGRLHFLKGVDVLLAAWAHVALRLTHQVCLVIVGDGPDHASLSEAVQAARMTDTIIFAGESQAVREYYRAGDIFVLPSRTEGLSNALLEAMASGLAVVASRVGGTPDLIDSGYNGLLFESELAEALAGCLTVLLDNPARGQELGAHARQTAVEKADIKTRVSELGQWYMALAGR